MSRFSHGGLERVQLSIASYFNSHNKETQLVVGKVENSLLRGEPPLNGALEIGKGGPASFVAGFVRAASDLKPDIIFTTANDLACLALLLRPLFYPRTKIVVTQHLSLSEPRKRARGLRRIKLAAIRLGMRILLPLADRIVAVSHSLEQDIRNELHLGHLDIQVIHNPIVDPEFDERSLVEIEWPWPKNDSPTVIFVGRFSPEKRLDLLVQAFSMLRLSTPAKLILVGTGPSEGEVRALIREQGLTDYCVLLPYTANPLPWVRCADVLVLASDFEGFGNVLVEAMACGTQVVSTNCPCGPSEILENGRYGQLVPTGDSDALAEALRKSLAREFFVSARELREYAQRFSQLAANEKYDRLVSELVHESAG